MNAIAAIEAAEELALMPLGIAAENLIIALSFFAIAAMIFAGLLRDRKLGVNPLGIATGFIFFTCATGHAVHAEHYLLAPQVFNADPDLWHQLVVDGFTVAAGVGYLTQRRRYGMVIRGTHPLLDYQKRLQMAEALRDIGQDIAAQTDSDRILRRVVLHARSLLQADYAAIVTVDESGRARNQVAGISSTQWSDEDWKAAVFLAGGSAGVTTSGQPIVLEDLLSEHGSGRANLVVHRAEGGRSALAVPVCRGPRVVGSLMVAYRSVRSLTSDDVSSAAALASQAAVALENARLIESLKQADRLKDEFLSAAAHELKTPVTAIKGWSEVLLGERQARVDSRMALETIHRGAERIARLSDDLLTVMQLRPSMPAINRGPVDLSQIVSDAVAAEQRVGRKNNLRLSKNHPMVVEADRALIADVVSRLLENAVRYSPTDGLIEVAAIPDGDDAIVSVTNYGTPVAPERQPHVFEPFYEPVPPGAEGYVGTVSLGLFLGKQIVEAHGGRIWFTPSENGGSTYSFSLPLAQKAV